MLAAAATTAAVSAAVSAAASATAVEVHRGGREVISKVKHKIDYASHLENNYNFLMEEAEKLYAEANKYKTKEPSSECEAWISSVMRRKEEVEELKTNSQFSALPVWDIRILHDREVRIKVTRSAE